MRRQPWKTPGASGDSGFPKAADPGASKAADSGVPKTASDPGFVGPAAAADSINAMAPAAVDAHFIGMAGMFGPNVRRQHDGCKSGGVRPPLVSTPPAPRGNGVAFRNMLVPPLPRGSKGSFGLVAPALTAGAGNPRPEVFVGNYLAARDKAWLDLKKISLLVRCLQPTDMEHPLKHHQDNRPKYTDPDRREVECPPQDFGETLGVVHGRAVQATVGGHTLQGGEKSFTRCAAGAGGHRTRHHRGMANGHDGCSLGWNLFHCQRPCARCVQHVCRTLPEYVLVDCF